MDAKLQQISEKLANLNLNHLNFHFEQTSVKSKDIPDSDSFRNFHTEVSIDRKDYQHQKHPQFKSFQNNKSQTPNNEQVKRKLLIIQ